LPSARPTCCRRRIIIWCSRCRRRSATSRYDLLFMPFPDHFECATASSPLSTAAGQFPPPSFASRRRQVHPRLYVLSLKRRLTLKTAPAPRRRDGDDDIAHTAKVMGVNASEGHLPVSRLQPRVSASAAFSGHFVQKLDAGECRQPGERAYGVPAVGETIRRTAEIRLVICLD